MRKLGILAVVLAIGVGWVLYRPLTMKTGGWKVRFGLMIYSSLFNIAYFGEYIGITPYYKTMRAFCDRGLISLLKTPSDIKVIHDVIGGVPAVIYLPAADDANHSKKKAGFVYYHGGGWVLGDAQVPHDMFVEMVRQLQLVVVSFKYRKAPEHIFPKPFEDCLSGLLGLAEVAPKYGVDPNKLIVSGDSAGGNLAAAVVGHLHGGGVPQSKVRVARLVLIYPVLQALDFTLPSFIQNKDEMVLDQYSMARYWQLYIQGTDSLISHMLCNNHSSSATRKKAKELIWKYIPDSPVPTEKEGPGDPESIHAMQSATSDALASPLLFSDSVLSKLPPVYIATCEYDVLRDEGIAFAQRLANLKHDVTHHNYLVYHGITGFYPIRISEALIVVDDMILYLLKQMDLGRQR